MHLFPTKQEDVKPHLNGCVDVGREPQSMVQVAVIFIGGELCVTIQRVQKVVDVAADTAQLLQEPVPVPGRQVHQALPRSRRRRLH